MKKIRSIFAIALVSLTLIGFSFAASLSQNEKKQLDSAISMIEKQWSKDSVFTQVSNYNTLIVALSNVKTKGDQKETVNYLLKTFKNKLAELKKQITTQDQVISNVDRDRVQSEWLAWHNEEREKKGLKAYKYSDSLNFTSLTWAQQIAKETRKTGSTHARKSGDGYWNTESIRERFSDLGVNVVYFSESNAYGYYNCKKSDCTQEIIDALKKCFNRTFLDSSHYPAVVSNTFDKIGVGVATNGSYVWVTTHYAKGVN